jgi:hypothetical protein
MQHRSTPLVPVLRRTAGASRSLACSPRRTVFTTPAPRATHYDTLSIPRNASKGQIKVSFPTTPSVTPPYASTYIISLPTTRCVQDTRFPYSRPLLDSPLPVEQAVPSRYKQRSPSSGKIPRVQRSVRSARGRQTTVRRRASLTSAAFPPGAHSIVGGTDGRTTVRSPRRPITNTLCTRNNNRTTTMQARMRCVGGARTTHGSADIARPRARIHTHTHMQRSIPSHRGAILMLAGPPAAHHITARHALTGRRPSWTVSTASLDLGGPCSSLDCSSL